jgi:hypothetical protein
LSYRERCWRGPAEGQGRAHTSQRVRAHEQRRPNASRSSPRWFAASAPRPTTARVVSCTERREALPGLARIPLRQVLERGATEVLVNSPTSRPPLEPSDAVRRDQRVRFTCPHVSRSVPDQRAEGVGRLNWDRSRTSGVPSGRNFDTRSLTRRTQEGTLTELRRELGISQSPVRD